MKRIFIIAIVLFLAGTAVHAQVPQTMNYQGVLTDSGGDAVSDGYYNVSFRIYDIAVGGSPLWNEDLLVPVTKGIFSVVLGLGTPINLPFDAEYWLGIAVEGSAELAPRVRLTTAPYAFSAAGVYGTGNEFPPSGHVGIGTTSPMHTLEVVGDASVQVPLYVRGGDNSWTSIYINANSGTSKPGYGYMRGGLIAHHYVDTGGTWHLAVGGDERLSATNTGRVGIGVTSPLEKLDVAGGLRLGTTGTTNSGTIRWTGTDFEGYDGSSWKSLTATGGGSLPAGTSGQTLRHDGSSWTATSHLYNNGSSIGIGTSSPVTDVHVYGTAEQLLRVETSSSGGSAAIELKTTDGSQDFLLLRKNGSTASGTIDGIALADLGLIHTGTQGGPMMLDVMSANPMYFLTSNVERMRLTADGMLGINTKNPGAKLHVDGNQWDLDGTEGDFKIGDATCRLKFGVATGGAGAGTAGIRVQGGAETLKIGAGSAEVLTIENNGDVSVGSDVQNGSLDIYRGGIATPVMSLYSTAEGALQYWDDEVGTSVAGLYADPSSGGEGGYFFVKRIGAYTAFRVDGNYNDTESPRVSIFGESRSAVFDMTQAGDLSVSLPVDAVSSTEISNEPGTASYTEGGGSGTDIGTAVTVIGSRSITVPASGYVLVIASGQVTINHSAGTSSYCQFGVSASNTSFPSNQEITVGVGSTAAPAYYHMGSTFHGLFEVAGAGTYTYYFLGDETSGAFTLYDAQLTLIYIPTSYGTVMPTMQGVERDETRENGRPGLTGAEIAAERSESEAANLARLESELAAMRAELESLREEMKEK